MKTCNKCFQEKPLDEFYSQARGKQGRTASCKECTRNSPAQLRKRRNNADRHRMSRYGVDRAGYEQMVSDQKGLCAICKKPCQTGRELAVDHDHETGAVRALLCMDCNTGIGKFGDDPERLMDAVTYLLSFKSMVNF